MPATLNHYLYCLNDPLVYVDLNGLWPEWATKAMKVVTIAAAGAAVAASFVVTAPVAVFAVSSLASACVGGVISGYANEANGGEYYAGYLGGFAAGGTQGILSATPLGAVGTLIGGAGNGLGSMITDNLNNLNPEMPHKTKQQIRADAKINAGKGILFSIPGSFMQGITSGVVANRKITPVAKHVNELDINITNGLLQLFGAIDNGIIAGDSLNPVEEKTPCSLSFE